VVLLKKEGTLFTDINGKLARLIKAYGYETFLFKRKRESKIESKKEDEIHLPFVPPVSDFAELKPLTKLEEIHQDLHLKNKEPTKLPSEKEIPKEGKQKPVKY